MHAAPVAAPRAASRQFRTRLCGGWLVTSFRTGPAAPRPQPARSLLQALRDCPAWPPL